MTRAPRLGWLFAYDWDRIALDAIEGDAGLAHFDHAGRCPGVC